MPITTYAATSSFCVYYALIGNNNRPTSADYRSNNPWKLAKAFCDDAPTARSATIAAAHTRDDSVFHFDLQPNALLGTMAVAIAEAFLNDLAAAISPLVNGDKLVAIVPDAGRLTELVHHTP